VLSPRALRNCAPSAPRAGASVRPLNFTVRRSATAMINSRDNPVQWASLVQELADASEHLEGLINKLQFDASYDEDRLRIDLGHVMAHLNRAWASRNLTRKLTDQEWESFRDYPKDLPPIA